MLKLLPYTIGGDEYSFPLRQPDLDEEFYADLMDVQALTRWSRKSKKTEEVTGGVEGK